MGLALSTGYNHYKQPEVWPEPDTIPKHDPLFGFEEGREQKVMKVTEAEMDSAKVPLEKRDYCAHLYIDFMECRAQKFPWVSRCEHQLHHYHDCQAAEYYDRMKDYEREKRLNARAKRIQAKAEKALAA